MALVGVNLLLTPEEVASLERILQNAANAGASNGSDLLALVRNAEKKRVG